MPNVMGREFPYTPEGMAAAQQYSQALGMRDGGMMGFRPIGMQAGGDVVNANRQVYNDFKQALTSLPMDELAEYIYNNLPGLKSMAEENPARAAQLRVAMEKSGFEGYMRNLMRGQEQMDQMPPDMAPLPPTGPPQTPPMMPEAPMMPMPPGGGPRRIPMDPNDPLLRQFDKDRSEWLKRNEPPFMSDPRYRGYYNPNQLNPFFNPDDIEVANGGYISRRTDRGGIMGLRGY